MVDLWSRLKKLIAELQYWDGHPASGTLGVQMLIDPDDLSSERRSSFIEKEIELLKEVVSQGSAFEQALRRIVDNHKTPHGDCAYCPGRGPNISHRLWCPVTIGTEVLAGITAGI